MKTQCSEQKPKFEKVGQFIHIYFDEEVIPATEDAEQSYSYCYCKVPAMISRNELIDAIVKIKYPTFDAEIAAIANGGVDSEEHQDWRNNAKLVASEIEEFKKTLF